MICYLLFTLAILVVAVLVIKFIVITSTGAIIIHCIILVINNALYGVPYSIEIHSVFKIKLNINCFIATAISILEKDVCILCKQTPKVTPFKNDVKVNPGKYGPMGNSIAPKKSAKAPTIPALIGPNLIAAITNGIKANPILMFHADIETNRDKTISKEINNPIITKGLVFVSRFSLFLVYIKTLLSYSYYKRSFSFIADAKQYRKLKKLFAQRQPPILRYLTH